MEVSVNAHSEICGKVFEKAMCRYVLQALTMCSFVPNTLYPENNYVLIHDHSDYFLAHGL